MDAAELTALAEKEGISPAVRVISSPSEPELRELISDCSVLVSASDFEGFGIAAVEGLFRRG